MCVWEGGGTIVLFLLCYNFVVYSITCILIEWVSYTNTVTYYASNILVELHVHVVITSQPSFECGEKEAKSSCSRRVTVKLPFSP